MTSPGLRFLVFQHVPVEHPGTFRDLMTEAGHSWHAVELDAGDAIPNLDDFDVMLVMGGPQDVWQEDEHPWFRVEKAAIRNWVSAGRPYLGMCLGEQLLADAMGGRVGLMAGQAEVGVATVSQTGAGAVDPLFAGLPQEIPCFQWHGAEVKELPSTARLLATGPGCVVQGFALGSHAYGLQFHVELTEASAQEWGELPEYCVALDNVMGPGSLPRLANDLQASLGELRKVARRIFTNFIAIAQAVNAGRQTL